MSKTGEVLVWNGLQARTADGDLYEVHTLSPHVYQVSLNGAAFPGWQSTGLEGKTVAQEHYYRTACHHLREEVKRLNSEIERLRSERSYVVGFNDGYDVGSGP